MMLKSLCCLIVVVLWLASASITVCAQPDKFEIIGYWITGHNQTGYVFAPDGTGSLINSDGSVGNTFKYVFDGTTVSIYDTDTIDVLKVAGYMQQGLVVFYYPKDRIYFTGIRAGTAFADLPSVAIETDDLSGTWWYGRDLHPLGFARDGQLTIHLPRPTVDARWKIVDQHLYMVSGSDQQDVLMRLVLLTDTLLVLDNGMVFYRIPEAVGVFGGGATVSGSNWQFDADGVLYTASSYPSSMESSYLQQASAADFVFSADVAAGQCEASLAIRMQDAQNGYLVVYRATAGGTNPPGLYFVIRRNNEERFLDMVTSGLPTVQEWVSLQVTAKGESIAVAVDGETRIEIADDTFLSGQNGFFVYGQQGRKCNTRFKDFSLQPIE